jgi:hypothetical protein
MDMAARTGTIKKYLEDGDIRLSKADREFLRDLSIVRIIDSQDAMKTHYQGRKTSPEKRLNKLCSMGLLKAHSVYQPERGVFKAYTFSNEKIASLFGGKLPVIGRKRNALHEVITSKIFFSLGRPEGFKLESDFTKDDKQFFEKNALLNGMPADAKKGFIPDAMCVQDGEVVIIEADSGQYTKSQIATKQACWGGLKQVWGQPSKTFSRVTGAKVFNYG